MKDLSKTLIILCGLLFTNASLALDPFGIFRTMDKTIDTLEKVDKTKEAIDTVHDVQEGIGNINTFRSLDRLKGASPIFADVREVYISAKLAPPAGSADGMNQVFQHVLCQNLRVISLNLERYKLRGATPTCLSGPPGASIKPNSVVMTVSQRQGAKGIVTHVLYVDHDSNEVLKELDVPEAKTYFDAIKYIVSNMHGDMLASSRRNDPHSTSKWPKRFHKYSKKSKHYKVAAGRKYKKQLINNKAT